MNFSLPHGWPRFPCQCTPLYRAMCVVLNHHCQVMCLVLREASCKPQPFLEGFCKKFSTTPDNKLTKDFFSEYTAVICVCLSVSLPISLLFSLSLYKIYIHKYICIENKLIFVHEGTVKVDIEIKDRCFSQLESRKAQWPKYSNLNCLCLFSHKKSVVIKLLSDSLIGLTVLEVSSSSFLPSLSDPPRLETQTFTTSGFFSLWNAAQFWHAV